jgi:hypothetical protein
VHDDIVVALTLSGVFSILEVLGIVSWFVTITIGVIAVVVHIDFHCNVNVANGTH